MLMIFCFQWSIYSQTSRPQAPQNQRPLQFTEQQFRAMLLNTSDPDSALELYVRYAEIAGRRNPAVFLQLIEEIESLEQVQELNKNAYSNLLKATYWNRSNIDSAAYYYRLAEQQFKALELSLRVVDVMQQRARALSRKNDFIEAENVYFDLLDFMEENKLDEETRQIIYNELTDLYIRVGAIEIALDRYNQLLEMGVQSNNAECGIRLRMSNAYKRNREMDKAVAELEQCIYKENVQNELKASIYRSLADLEKIRGNQQQRLAYSIKASELVTSVSGVYFGTNLFLGESYFENNMYQKTDSVIAILNGINPRRVQLPARINFLILKTKNSLQKEEYDQAIQFADEGLTLGQRMPQAILNVELQRLKADALQQLGEYEEAFAILRSLSENERLIQETGRIQMEEMNKVRFQMRAKNLELEAVNAKLSLVRFRTFSIICLLIIIGGFFVYRYRLKTALQEERTRTKIANDLHDEVSATLTGITFFAEAVRKDPNQEKKSHFINLIAESAGEAKEKITDIVWSITPENDNWELLLAKCRRYASDLFESRAIEYDLNIANSIEGKIDMNLRQHIWMIYKELITNAVRHAQATKIRVEMKQEKDHFLLSVTDDGLGFDTTQDFEGNGLKNIKRRSDKIKGTLNLQSIPKQGTQCELRIPLP